MPTLKAKDKLFRKKSTLNCHGKIISLDTPLVMGILNVTPDSFYAESRLSTLDAVLQKAQAMLTERADILDIGGYSTRPGAKEVSVAEETDRVVPAIEAIIKQFPDTIISVDTFRAEVAEAAIHAGASIINDVSGGSLDETMFDTVARLQVPYILMHMRGTPETMTTLTNYDDVVLDVLDDLQNKVTTLNRLGVNDIILDPGFGFAKTIDQNFELLRRLDTFHILELPILAGLSRKSMTYKFLGIDQSEALAGTIALNMLALTKGADILRVHDVQEAKQTIQLYIKTTL